MHPALYNGPRMVEAAGRAHRRPAAPHRRGRHDRRAGRGSAASPASSSSTRRTSPAGTTRAGSTPRRSAAAGSACTQILAATARSIPARPKEAGRRRRPCSKQRARVLERPGALDADASRAAALRAARARGRRRDSMEAGAVPGARRERAAPADRRVPRPADRMTTADRLRRVPRADAAARASPAAALPAIEPGMPIPGRDRADAPRLRRALARARADRLRRRAGSTSSTRASPPPRPAPQQPILVTRLPAGRRGRAVAALLRRATRSTASCARTSPSPAARRSPRTTGSSGIRRSSPLAQLHGEGKVDVLPAVGYDHPDQSHFTSRHFWEVGATDTRLLTGWLGRYLDVVGTPGQPAAGAVADRLAAAGARDREGAGRGDRRPRPVRLLDARRLGRGRGRGCSTRSALLGTPAAPTRRCATVGERDRRRPTTLRTQLAPFAGKEASRRPSPYPAGDDSFPTALQGLAAMIAAGLPLRCVALEATGEYDTHAGQASALTPALTTTAASLYAFQRDLEARGVADRVLTLVWSEFGRRAKENGSGGTDHGAAGTGFLIGTRAAGTQVGEFPGLATGLDADGNLKATSDFRGVYASLLEQWLDVRRRARHPRRADVRAADARQVKLALVAARARRAVRTLGAPPPGARAGRRARVLVHALAAPRARGHGDDRARELRPGSARPARAARSARGTSPGSASSRPGKRGELDGEARPGAILVLVLGRESPPARHASDARRHALSARRRRRPGRDAGRLPARRRRLAALAPSRRLDRRRARRAAARGRPLRAGAARRDRCARGRRRPPPRSTSSGSASSAGRRAGRTRSRSPRSRRSA